METLDKDTKNQVLFFQLVSTFQNAAWQQLGKRMNPITQKMEKDLEQASLSIDMLDMLLAKTQGNLSDEEKRFLEQIIGDLKLNYIEVMNQTAKAKTPEEKPKTQPKPPKSPKVKTGKDKPKKGKK
jgi:DNA replication initiation complex subunit (GINS family)